MGEFDILSGPGLIAGSVGVGALLILAAMMLRKLIRYMRLRRIQLRLRKTHYYVDASVMAWLADLGDAAIEPLLALLRSENVDIAERAAEAFGKLEGKHRTPQSRQVSPASHRLSVDRLIDMLLNTDSRIAERAANALCRMKCKREEESARLHTRAVEALIATLEGGNVAKPDRRDSRARRASATFRDRTRAHIRIAQQAVLALGQIRNRRAVEALLGAALGHADRGIRQAASGALGQIGDSSVTEALLATIANSDRELRLAAIAALGQQRNRQAVPTLVAALSDADHGIGIAAAAALGQIGDVGDASVTEALLATVAHSDRELRLAAIAALGQQRNRQAVPALVAALRDKDQRIATASSKALGQIGGPEAIKALTAAIGVPGDASGFELAVVLANMGAAPTDAVIAALQHPNNVVRETAAELLGWFRDAQAVEPLIAVLARPGTDAPSQAGASAVMAQARVRRIAADSLGEIGDPRAIAPLVASLGDADHELVEAATLALARFGEAGIEGIITALGNPRTNLRAEAATTLGKLFVGDVTGSWEDGTLLTDQNREMLGRRSQRTASNWGCPGYWTSTRKIPSKAQLALCKIIDDRAVRPLIAALNDADPGVRQGAAFALGRIRNPQALEPLIATLGDTDGNVRKNAAAALGQLRAQRAAEPLIAHLQDGQHDIAATAAEALGEIGDALAIAPLAAPEKKGISIWSHVIRGLAQKNAKLLSQHPDLLCIHCALRSEQRSVKADGTRYRYVVCRGCGSSLALRPGIREVHGVIGGPGGPFIQTGDLAAVYLWSETDKAARNCDIDRLVILPGDVADYQRAVNAVVNALREDVSRPRDALRRVPVAIEGGVALPPAALGMLKDSFGEVTAA